MDTWLIILMVATILLWLIALIDILRSQFKSTRAQIAWIIMILVAPLLGAVLYFGFKDKFVIR